MKWEKVELGSILDFQAKSKIKAGDGLQKGIYPFYTSSGSLSKFINDYQFDKPSLILGTGGNASIHYCDKPFAVSTDCFVVQSHDPKKAFAKYLYHYLSGNIHLLESGFKGAGLKHISKKHITELTVPLPSLPVQERIAAILDEADALRKKDAELLQKYDELLQSIFYTMFGDFDTDNRGWSTKNVGSLLSTKKDGTKCGPFGSALKKDEYVETGIPVWIMDNIQGLDFVPNGCLFVTEEKFRELESYSVENNDIIISRAGTVGKMTVINGLSYPSIISTNLIRLSLNTDIITPHYFVHLMKYSGDKFGRLKKGKDGAFTHMNTGIIKSLDIPFPPMKLQMHFSKALEGIKKLKQTIVTQQAQSEALFQSLMQRAFKGEL